MNLDQILDSVYPLPQQSKDAMKPHIREVQLPKGHLLFEAGRIVNTIYLVKKGMVRAYSDTENNQVTFWFGKEGDIVICMKSHVANEKGYENIELLEDSEIYEMDSGKINVLFETDIHIANWGRKFAEMELLRTEERFISRQFKTASERYADLLKNFPHLIQRVQLGHIASYLGITQASLSRIRAEIK